MLVRVKASQFKSVAEADIKLSSRNIVVGTNSAGKSNFIDIIYFARDAIRDDLDTAVMKRHGIDSIRRWSKTRPYHISVHLFFESGDTSGDYRFVLASAQKSFSVLEEEARWTARPPFRLGAGSPEILTSGFHRDAEGNVKFDIEDNPFGNFAPVLVSHSELLLSQFSGPSASPISLFFTGLVQEITGFSRYSIYPNTIRLPQSISVDDILADDGSNLASIIKKMGTTSARRTKENLTTGLKQVLPILQEIRIEQAGGFYVPTLRVQEAGQPYAHDLNMSQISDGTLRMLGLLCAFYQPKAPGRIAIEEPEQMIHPGLLPILNDASLDYLGSEERHQMIMTTHSPNLLDLFAAEDIIRAEFDEGVTKVSRISERQKSVIKRKLFTPGELLVAEGFF